MWPHRKHTHGGWGCHMVASHDGECGCGHRGSHKFPPSHHHHHMACAWPHLEESLAAVLVCCVQQCAVHQHDAHVVQCVVGVVGHTTTHAAGIVGNDAWGPAAAGSVTRAGSPKRVSTAQHAPTCYSRSQAQLIRRQSAAAKGHTIVAHECVLQLVLWARLTSNHG